MLVATAGHVDHGKTSLVRHLTGVDTDRLAEEKKRGLTIELGYAFREAGSGEPIGFIDVPGHHRFINTMIAGITGIDLGLLVVAADDGPMPQTLEHLQLLRLLGVERFIGVISKSDLVDRERLEQVRRELNELLPGAPLCPVSHRTGDGLEELASILATQALECPGRTDGGPFRMYIDRVFTRKGAGLVVTGTGLSGTVAAGDELRLHTLRGDAAQVQTIRVRDVHSQGRSSAGGHAGQRCALNITGKVSLEDVQRGNFLCAHPTALPAQRLDTRCRLVDPAERPMKHLGRVKLHIGTRRVGARTYLLERGDRDQVGRRVQLILDEPVLAFSGDRFVLREDNETRTLAGGIVIDPVAPRWGKSRDKRLRHLDALEAGSPVNALKQLLLEHEEVISLEMCRRTWNLSPAELDKLLEPPATEAGSVVRVNADDGECVLSRQLWDRYTACVESELKSWHRAQPGEPGMRPADLQTLLLGQIPPALFKPVLVDRVQAGKIHFENQVVRADGHSATRSAEVQRAWERLYAILEAHGLDLPLRSEIQSETGLDPKRLEQLVRPAVRAGDLFEIGEKRLALPATLADLAGRVREFTHSSGGISVIEAKQLFGLGRNVTIEVLEFFDEIGYTRRHDNLRVIANPDAARQRLGE